MISSIFLCLAGALFIYLSYRQILSGILVIVALLPAYLWRWEIFGLPSTFLELMIVSLFIIWLLKDGQYKKINWTGKEATINPLPVAWRWLLILWLLVSALALLVSFNMAALGLWRAYFLEPIMFFIVFVYTVKSPADLKKILSALSILILWLLALALYQNFSTWNFITAYNYPNAKRLTSIFFYPNALSLITASISALLVAYGLVNIRLKNYYLYFVVGLVGALLSYLALSQGAVIALAVSFIFWLILAKKTRKLSLAVLGLIIIISFLITPIRNHLSIWQQEIFRPEINLQASSLEIRSSQWQETWAMLIDKPIFGAGLNAYQKTLAPYHKNSWLEIYLYPHNIFLNFWSELGIVGLIIFLLIMGYLIFTLRKLFLAKNLWAWPLTMAWSTWFIHGLVDVPYFKNDLSVLFFIMLGMTIIVASAASQKRF